MSASTLDRGVSRRGFLKGLAGILAAGMAPAAIGSGVLMPIKKLWTPGPYDVVVQVGPMTATEVLDYQRMYNYWMNQAMEATLIRPKAPWLT